MHVMSTFRPEEPTLSKRIAEVCFEKKPPMGLLSFLTLHPHKQLDDELIYRYLELIEQRSEDPEHTGHLLPRVHAMNSHFMSTYRGMMGDHIPFINQEVKFPVSDIIFIPVHIVLSQRSGHWALIVVDQRAHTICYYDSMLTFSRALKVHTELKMVNDYIVKVHRHYENPGMSEFKNIVMPKTKVPQQTGGLDCGVFVCLTAEHLSRGAGLEFTQQEMPHFRLKMMAEIAGRKLLPY